MENLLPNDVESTNKNIEDLDKIQFDFSPDNSLGKLVITSHGEKGAGKTTGIFLITTGRIGGFPPGKTNVISFDNKSKITKEQYFPEDDITVWNGKQHYREDPDICTKSGVISYKYIQKLIQSWKLNPPAWIVFDGLTIMSTILEMAMRYKHGLQPSQGVANRNVWKDRARFMQDLHNLACSVATYGVAYTTYSEKDQIVEAGTVISQKDVAKYIDIVMTETDLVLHTTKIQGKSGDLFYLRVESAKHKVYLDTEGKKIPKVDTTLTQGRTFDVTNLTEVPAKKSEPPKTEIKQNEPIKIPEVPKPPVVTPIEPIKYIETPKPPQMPITSASITAESPKTEQKKWQTPDLLML